MLTVPKGLTQVAETFWSSAATLLYYWHFAAKKCGWALFSQLGPFASVMVPEKNFAPSGNCLRMMAAPFVLDFPLSPQVAMSSHPSVSTTEMDIFFTKSGTAHIYPPAVITME